MDQNHGISKESQAIDPGLLMLTVFDDNAVVCLPDVFYPGLSEEKLSFATPDLRDVVEKQTDKGSTVGSTDVVS